MTERRLRILQVSTSDVGGGAEVVARNLMDSYRANSDECWLAVGRKYSSDAHIFQIPHDPYRNFWELFWLNLAGKIRLFEDKSPSVRVLRAFADLLADPSRLLGHEDFNYPGTRKLLDTLPEPPDVMHLHNLHGQYFDLRVLPELSQARPTVITMHDNWLLTGHCAYTLACDRWKIGCGACPDLKLYPAILRDATAANWRLKQDLYKRSRLYVATPSQWLMDMVEHSMLSHMVAARRIIPNGIDLSVFHPGSQAESREILGLDQAATIVLLAANKVKTSMFKDFATIEKALRLVGANFERPLLCLAVGEKLPPLRFGMAEVQFLPYESSPSRVAHFYRAANLYVHAARADNFPLTVLEALACGTPVIATAVGGIPEQIRDGETGFLVPQQDPDAMAAVIMRVLSDSALMTHIGNNAAIEAKQRFDLKTQSMAYRNWYLEILESLPTTATRRGRS